MAGIPSCNGWRRDDWFAWFEHLLGAAKENLRELGSGEANQVRRVHEARKLMKRLRAGTHLLAGLIPKSELKHSRVSCRDAGRLLAPSRDGTVRLQTFDALISEGQREADASLQAARRLLAQEVASAAGSVHEHADKALGILAGLGMQDVPGEDFGKAEVKKGIGRLLRRARNDYVDLVEGRNTEFHEMRKRVKDLYYSIDALPGSSNTRKRAHAALGDFEEALGLHNDVVVLEEWLDERDSGQDQVPAFWEIARRRKKKLGKVVMEKGTILHELGQSTRYCGMFAAAHSK